jgi:hypothetical protein
VARRLFQENRDRRSVRLLGVTLAGLDKPHGVDQPSIFPSERRKRALSKRIDDVRDRWGERSVLPAAALR